MSEYEKLLIQKMLTTRPMYLAQLLVYAQFGVIDRADMDIEFERLKKNAMDACTDAEIEEASLRQHEIDVLERGDCA